MTDTAAHPHLAASPAQLLYPELAVELAATRRILERVPDDKLGWKPHDKSMSLSRLATHLAELPSFGAMILGTDEMDWATFDYKPREFTTTAQIVALFDEQAAAMTAAVEAMEWSTVDRPWTMRMGDHVILNGKKGVLLRSLGLSHMAHHRGQLSVYLRLVGAVVPGVYGPSADES